MINRIIDWSVGNRGFVFALFAAFCVAGWWHWQRVPVDALPNLGETQVLVYSKWDRSPDLVESQVTYPIVTALVGSPKVKSVRAITDFGYSYVYVTFQEGTDLYWARSRVQEYLAITLPRLPQGAVSEIGPDATALGWIYQYAIIDPTHKHDLADLRSLQDWHIKYQLKSVAGVAEVASVGGYGKQFQVNIDPDQLAAHDLSIQQVMNAVRGGNREASGRVIEFGNSEFMIRGHGLIKSITDIESLVVKSNDKGTVLVRDVAQVEMGPDSRRGLCDFDGQGEVVSGIIVMRHGENAIKVLNGVKLRLQQIQMGLPSGVQIVPVYDRSILIDQAMRNLKQTLFEVMLVVVLVICVFLWDIPSALIPAITIPIAVLVSFVPFQLLGLTANIMSFSGMAIAIGALVDAAIIMVEQVHKNLERQKLSPVSQGYVEVVLESIKQVSRPAFYSLLVIAISFLPILMLENQEGRLFKPLAYTKTFAMLAAAVLLITLDPALRISFARWAVSNRRPKILDGVWKNLITKPIQSERNHPISGRLMALYQPILDFVLRKKKWVLFATLLLMVSTIPIFISLGREFMPPLDEGNLFYMPSSKPGISITEAKRLVHVTDAKLKSFPEVDHVLGKAGRSDSATDPAPLSMLETLIVLKPKSEWRRVPTWYSSWSPEFLKPYFRLVTSDTISTDALISEMSKALQVPGLANGWTMPIKGRIEMQNTGLRIPLGLKIIGDDLATIEKVGRQIESVLARLPETQSAFAERTGSGFFLDIEWNRGELARNGLSMDDAQVTVENSLGGDNLTTVYSGRERYPVNVRYKRDFRSDEESLQRMYVTSADGRKQVRVSDVARLVKRSGPAMVRDEDALLTGYVFVDIKGKDYGSYLQKADKELQCNVHLPPGYAFRWSGEFESMLRVQERLKLIIPLTIMLISALLYTCMRSWFRAAVVLLAVPFSAIGAIWFLYILGYNLSAGVWVGIIALMGVDAETGVFMLTYLDLAYDDAKRYGRLSTRVDLQNAIREGAVQRLRPKFMTVATMVIGLLPIMWSVGTGADLMKHIAAPMIGGIATSFLLELLVYPIIYEMWKWHTEVKHLGT
jgi:Cu(I)/Ag(I) efflux system membrane protein CusA/SilA